MPVLFAHPAYWWLRRRIRDDQEVLADAAAVAAGGRIGYAQALLLWAVRESGWPAVAVLGFTTFFVTILSTEGKARIEPRAEGPS